jgi:hypothetical protein
MEEPVRHHHIRAESLGSKDQAKRLMNGTHEKFRSNSVIKDQHVSQTPNLKKQDSGLPIISPNPSVTNMHPSLIMAKGSIKFKKVANHALDEFKQSMQNQLYKESLDMEIEQHLNRKNDFNYFRNFRRQQNLSQVDHQHLPMVKSPSTSL